MGTLPNTRRKRTRRGSTLGFKLKVVASVEQGDMTSVHDKK
ncbi:hypothetical protein [Endozoicomonas euniceicola]|uniref:Uncharacterized protein n=1 Tax=Endozoicomonas euniceicola TaxID=1234143 RepID=A0ABY6GUC8_9GAMM|nr:hypothetical protein [Endozoicomonas euniceicola]UYM16390.1 hypothetical protein NX720_00180 [Endozoicomonas euniceicola]